MLVGMAKRPTGECPTCRKEVFLDLYWKQSGPAGEDWKLRSRCYACKRELGLVKQTQEALRAAPPKVPQLFFDFGAGPEAASGVRPQEIDPT